LIRFYLYHDWTLNYRNLFPLRLIKEKEKRIGEHLMVTKEQDTWHCETKECIACYLLPNSIKLQYFFHLFPSIYFYYCNIYYNLKLSCVWVCHSSLQPFFFVYFLKTEIAKMSNTRESIKEWFKSSQALMSMLLVQLFATGMQLLSRVILVQGTYVFSLLVYRHIVAAFCVAPFALYFER
jgi:hypothetical protein